MQLIMPLVFYSMAAILVAASVMVVVSRNPVQGALFLVLAFVASAFLWMMLEAEFLSLALIFVYVGAVMTLFLFVVMMLNIDEVPRSQGFVKFLPFGLIIMALLLGVMILAIGPKPFGFGSYETPPMHSATYSNVQSVGEVLYTHYALAFEAASFLLLVAIIAAITLTHRGRRSDAQSQIVANQVATQANEQVQLMDVKPDGDPFQSGKTVHPKRGDS